MKVLLQRVTGAWVEVDGQRIAETGAGLLAFVGVVPGDGQAQVAWLAEKAAGLRIFPGDGKPMNRSVVDVGGEVLVVSQFTLAADTSRGKRPSFTGAAAPGEAQRWYEAFVAELGQYVPVQGGRFGADMAVGLVNDGPVTIMLEH